MLDHTEDFVVCVDANKKEKKVTQQCIPMILSQRSESSFAICHQARFSCRFCCLLAKVT